MMQDIVFRKDITYQDLDGVDVELKLVGGWLCIETIIERVTINDTELRYDGTPRNIIEYLLSHSSKTVTIEQLKKANLATSRDLRQVLVKAGIKGYIRDVFVCVREKDKVQLNNKVTLRAAEADALINSLYYH